MTKKNTWSENLNLRSRWQRWMIVLIVLIVAAEVFLLAQTNWLLESMQRSARDLDYDETLIAHLQTASDVYAGHVNRFLDGQIDAGRETARATLFADFDRGIRTLHSAKGRKILEQAVTEWAAAEAATIPFDPTISEVKRLQLHQDITAAEIRATALLNEADAASRSEDRNNLVRSSHLQRWATVGDLFLMVFIGILLWRFAHKLSTQVLQPIEVLRSGASRLAQGELDHRIDLASADELGGLATSFNDMASEIAKRERVLEYHSNNDSLTGLLNRRGFLIRLTSMLQAGPDRRRGQMAVLFLDLDDFKNVNDTLGHAAGDELLRIVASRLREVARPDDAIARFGGDEFALLLVGLPKLSVASTIADRIVDALSHPVHLSGTRLRTSASVGLAVRTSGLDSDTLIRRADLAMYSAKRAGKNQAKRYAPALEQLDPTIAHRATVRSPRNSSHPAA